MLDPTLIFPESRRAQSARTHASADPMDDDVQQRPYPLPALLATVAAFLAMTLMALAAVTWSAAAETGTKATTVPTQSFAVSFDAAAQSVERPEYGYQPGYETYMASGTNHDWARIVLTAANWPVTESNVTVITRWMRQENYLDTWWNRNNPLNNGWGSGGGGGLGSYNTLLDAALNAAEALHTHPGYAAIVDGFARSAPTAEIEAAIWASPWASGHYNNGKHWHYSPVPVITAPQSAWR